ncbi:MAG: TlyA family RNA methyltransferase [Clostridia bacterium]|nr:TlyA family RNA methyltransferase [Clostridia bacterium]
MSNERRLDSAVVECGFVTGRDKAKELIRSGAITVNGKTVDKPSFCVATTDTVACTVETSPFVSRGGVKLQHALPYLAQLPSSFVAMDVGASTGGFTQCLLQHGAAKVYAVDVGHGQLHSSLSADERVVNLEGTDIRNTAVLQTVIPAKSVEVVAVDVSFISLHTVLPALLWYLKPKAQLILLVKPQFEAGKAAVGKNGVVHDRREHYRVLRELCDTFEKQNLALQHLMASPIVGGAGRRDGNIEYLAVLQYGGVDGKLPDIRRLVDTAFLKLK